MAAMGREQRQISAEALAIVGAIVRIVWCQPGRLTINR